MGELFGVWACWRLQKRFGSRLLCLELMGRIWNVLELVARELSCGRLYYEGV